MKYKYIVYPGYVRSKHDGEMHYIGFDSLVNLYGVHPGECINAHSEYSLPVNKRNLIPLVPKYDGNYILEDNNENID